MKANLLRIGNLLSVGNYDVKVVEIHHLGVQVCDLEETQDTWELFSDRIKPIPLTEEWLLKFGFVTTQWDNFDSYRFEIGNNDYAIVIYSDGNCEVGDVITTKINYVHQLQNLYFAITGEELTFKSE